MVPGRLCVCPQVLPVRVCERFAVGAAAYSQEGFPVFVDWAQFTVSLCWVLIVVLFPILEALPLNCDYVTSALSLMCRRVAVCGVLTWIMLYKDKLESGLERFYSDGEK